MNAHTIFERDLNGEMVSPSDPGYDENGDRIEYRLSYTR